MFLSCLVIESGTASVGANTASALKFFACKCEAFKLFCVEAFYLHSFSIVNHRC